MHARSPVIVGVASVALAVPACRRKGRARPAAGARCWGHGRNPALPRELTERDCVGRTARRAADGSLILH